MTAEQLTTTCALGLGSLAFMLRAKLLCSDAGGWPHAPKWVRWPMFVFGLLMLGRACLFIARPAQEPVDLNGACTALALAAYALVMVANVLRQRDGWELAWPVRRRPPPNP